MDIHLHQLEKFMYLDALINHKLQHPMKIRDHFLKRQQYELFHKILLLLLMISNLISF
jgi:hypothetical protein